MPTRPRCNHEMDKRMIDEYREYVHSCLTRVMAVLSALVIGGTLPACSRMDSTPAGPPDKIVIAYSATPNAALAIVAQMQGYFLREGLEVTPHLLSYGKLALNEVLVGKADFATVADTPMVFAILNGEKISVLATIQSSTRDNAIVARKDRGIHSVDDLKGKKLAVTLGTTADFYLDTFLAANRIARKEIQIVDLKAEALPEALARGEVDAVATFNPYMMQAQMTLGAGAIAFSDENLYTSTFNLVAKQDFIRKNPEKVDKILRALLKAEEFARKNPEAAQKIVADFSRMEMTLVRRLWPDSNFQVSLEQSLVLAMEDESRWAIKAGLASKVPIPNYLDFIYFDGLQAAKLEAVRILR